MPLDKQNGYVIQDYNETLNDIKADFMQKFGSDIDLSDDSVFGGFANILAQDYQDKDKNAEAIYWSLFTLTATGSELDDKGANSGIYRKPATNSFVTLTIQGYVDSDNPTVITADDGEFSTADGKVFKILNDVTIDQPYSNLQDEDGNQLGQVDVQAISVDTGSQTNVTAHSIVNAEQSIDGFYSVTNNEPSTGGQDTETDDSFRNRLLANNLYMPNSTPNGLVNAIRNLDSVIDARLIENNTMNVDEFGNQPMSAHFYVIGGNDDDIAQTILKYMPPLMRTNGNVVKTATDIAGTKYEIRFDHAQNVQIYVKVNINVDDSSFNTDTGLSEIKQNIINYFSDLRMGSTVDFTKLFAPCYSVSGVTGVTLALGKDKNNLVQNQNVQTTDFELPVVSSDSIDIEINKAGD